MSRSASTKHGRETKNLSANTRNESRSLVEPSGGGGEDLRNLRLMRDLRGQPSFFCLSLSLSKEREREGGKKGGHD